MGGPSLFFRTDDRPLTEMTRKVMRAVKNPLGEA